MHYPSFTRKAISLALILVSTTGMVFAADKDTKDTLKAEPCPPQPVLKSGWYLGLQGGYDAYRIRNGVSAPAGTTIVTNPALYSNGWVGGLMLGYGMMANNWLYLGGEIFGNFSDVEQYYSLSRSGTTYTNKIRANTTYGLGLLPGLKLTDTTLSYVRLGWNIASFKSKESVTGVAVGSKNNTSNGFTFGVGMETLMADDWSLRGEFNHTWYGSYNTKGVYGTSVSPSDSQYMLSVMYHFA